MISFSVNPRRILENNFFQREAGLSPGSGFRLWEGFISMGDGKRDQFPGISRSDDNKGGLSSQIKALLRHSARSVRRIQARPAVSKHPLLPFQGQEIEPKEYPAPGKQRRIAAQTAVLQSCLYQRIDPGRQRRITHGL